MQLTTVKELFKERDKYLNQEIQVGGWIRSIRDSKAFGFIVLNDGTSFDTLQIVYHDTMANFAEVSKLNVGAAIIVKGTLVATPEAKQPFEIQATEVTVLAQLRASAGKAQVGGGVDEAEQGDGHQYLFFRQRRAVLQQMCIRDRIRG